MTRSVKRLSRAVSTGLLLASLATPVEAAGWPERTVRIIVPGNAGSSPDAVARTLADMLAKRWKQPVVVENRPGADGIIATRGFLEIRDGHALLFTTHSTVTVVPLLNEKLPYDPVRDVVPISLAAEDFLIIVVSPSLPVNSLTEFVTLARARPKTLNFFAAFGAPYLSYLAFQKREGFETTFVPYRTGGSLTDLSEGRIHVGVLPIAFALGQVRDGRIKPLAVTNEVRSPAAPEVPTVAEARYPDLTFGGLLGLFGPKEMAPDVRERIAADVRAILNEPEVNQRLTNLGLLAYGTTPAEFAKIIDEQRAKWAAIAREHNIKPKTAQ